MSATDVERLQLKRSASLRRELRAPPLCEGQQLTPFLSPRSDITFARTRSDGSFSTINFHFNPLGDAARLSNYISSALLSPASHILFIAPTAPLGDNTDPSMYAIKMRKALDVFADLAKEAKIAVATSFGVVQSQVRCSLSKASGLLLTSLRPQDCSDKAETHRKTLEPGNAALLECVLPLLLSVLASDLPSDRLVRGYPNVEPLDVYSLQIDRPDAVRSPAGHAARPEEGVLEHTLVDIVMESWRQLAT